VSARQAATATDLRAQSAAVANILTEASAARALNGDAVGALVCQLTGDVHRVAAALWNRAATLADPHQEFFRLAELVLTAAGRPEAAGCSASVLVGAVRAAFSEVCAGFGIPLVFPAATHLDALDGPVDLTGIPVTLLGELTPELFVLGQLSAARANASEPAAMRAALGAYTVDVAAATGDTAMITAAARMIAVEVGAPRGNADLGRLTATIKRVLGTTEWVRFRPYLRQAGIGAD
jgi:hypothetical protein